MNGAPHAHEVKVRRQYGYDNTGGYRVDYGDTTVSVLRGPFLEARLRRAVRRAKRRHDRGSLRAESRASEVARLSDAVRRAELPEWPS